MTPKEALFIVANPNGVSRVQLAIASNIIKTIVAKAEPMEVIKVAQVGADILRFALNVITN
jgi:hypothetical protein